jgi:exodeoxyribonuclease VII small subunit
VSDQPNEHPESAGEESLDFETALGRVESIIERIESGEIGLERSVGEYERGMKLIARCRRILAQAEQRVEDLNRSLDGQADEDAGGGAGAGGPSDAEG